MRRLCPRRPADQSFIQRKLVFGQPNDPLEHEADRVADEVMHMRDPAPTSEERIQRQPARHRAPSQQPLDPAPHISRVGAVSDAIGALAYATRLAHIDDGGAVEVIRCDPDTHGHREVPSCVQAVRHLVDRRARMVVRMIVMKAPSNTGGARDRQDSFQRRPSWSTI